MFVCNVKFKTTVNLDEVGVTVVSLAEPVIVVFNEVPTSEPLPVPLPEPFPLFVIIDSPTVELSYSVSVPYPEPPDETLGIVVTLQVERTFGLVPEPESLLDGFGLQPANRKNAETRHMRENVLFMIHSLNLRWMINSISLYAAKTRSKFDNGF